MRTENGRIILGLMGLGMFFNGMKLRSDARWCGRGQNEKYSGVFLFYSFEGYSRRNIFYGGNPVLKRVYCYGSQLCKLRSDESLSGGGSDHGCQYWHYSNFATDFFESV